MLMRFTKWIDLYQLGIQNDADFFYSGNYYSGIIKTPLRR